MHKKTQSGLGTPAFKDGYYLENVKKSLSNPKLPAYKKIANAFFPFLAIVALLGQLIFFILASIFLVVTTIANLLPAYFMPITILEVLLCTGFSAYGYFAARRLWSFKKCL